MKTSLSQVRAANPTYFSAGNKRFFGDVNYSVLRGQSRKPYLLTTSYKWSGMLGGNRELSYYIKAINPDTMEIESVILAEFNTREKAKAWIKQN